MDSFDNYQVTDASAMYFPDDMNFPDDGEQRLLLDMDTIMPKRTNVLTTRICEPTRKKCYLGDDREEIDGTGWVDKPIEKWCKQDSANWLLWATGKIGLPYDSVQNTAIPGKDLITLTRKEFMDLDPIYGSQLFDLLPLQTNQNLLPPFDTIHPHSDDEFARMSSSNVSDAESENSVEISVKRPPGRPRVMKQKKSPTGQGKLWEFIRDLLLNPETCPSLICWEDYTQGKFRFVKSDEVAKRWGSRKGNTKMTYEKLSRAMRYYYKSKIFQPVLGRRLVYQFGPNAKGWKTDNPNFRH